MESDHFPHLQGTWSVPNAVFNAVFRGALHLTVRPELVEGRLFAQQVCVASIDDLLVMKRAANRAKDKLDITALEKIKRGENPND